MPEHVSPGGGAPDDDQPEPPAHRRQTRELADTLGSDEAGDDDVAHVAPARGMGVALERGGRIDRFLILDRLGAGGMGVVVSAYDPDLDRKVALKVLRADTQSVGTVRSRQQLLIREAQVIARLSHPNVITVYDVGTVDEQVFIAMEYVDGGTLNGWLAERPRSWREIVEMFVAAGRGLAAAHAAGLVHRDFKPDNVLLGKDGRARVTDFGLAATTGAIERAVAGGEIPAFGEDSPLAFTLAQPGVLIGTPLFMAPEQYQGEPVDARTDQFSFCVALYRSLYREHPFGGDSTVDLGTNVCAGNVRAAAAGVKVPSRLRAAIVRGLSADPAARHPSMDVLIGELASLVAAQRRHRRWAVTVALVVAATALTISAAFLWRLHTERRAMAAREAAASSLLTTTLRRIDELTGAGRVAEADAAFTAFIDVDEHRGTEALARAWLAQARRLRERGRYRDEVAAWASAWASAPVAAGQAEALLGLASAFHRHWQWDRLEIALRRLDRDFRGYTTVRQLAPLRVAALLANRDLSRAAAYVDGIGDAAARTVAGVADAVPALSALAQGRPTNISAHAVSVTALDGAPALLVLSDDHLTIRALRADPALTPLWTARLPEGETTAAIFPFPLADGQLRLITPQHGTASVYRREGDRFVVEHRWPEGTALSSARFDVDGDGIRDFVLGTGPYSRRLLVVARTPTGWELTEPYREVAGSASDFNALHAADLDGDGEEELIAAVGPWQHYDVRIARRGAGGLVTAGRFRLGTVADVDVVQTAQGLRIAAAKSDVWPSRYAFPDGDGYGAVAGVHLLRWDGTALAPVGLLAAPRPEDGDRELHVGPLVVADVDGDGRDDLLATIKTGGHPPHALIARQRADGTFAVVLVGELEIYAAAELDGDPGTEIIARLHDSPQLWVLGAGGRLPPVERAPPPSAERPASAGDSISTRMWSRAEDLVAMGLGDHAAGLLDQIADLGGPASDRARLRAGALWEAAGDPAGAADRFEAVAGRDAGAALRAAELRARHHEFDAAHRIATALSTRRDASAAERAAAHELLSKVGPRHAAPRLDWSFVTSLPAAWRIIAPESVRRELGTGSLRLDVSSTNDHVVEVPAVVASDWIRISVDLDLQRTEWGTGVHIALIAPGGKASAHIGVGVDVQGGGGMLRRYLGCVLPGQHGLIGARQPLRSPEDAASLTLAVDYVPSEGIAWCTITDRAGGIIERRRHAVAARLPDGPLLLVIRNGGEARVDLDVQASVAIRRMELRGIEVASGSEDATRMGHRRLAEGDPAGALAAYDTAGAVRDPSWTVGRILALTSLERRRDAADELRRALADPRREGAVWRMLRIHDATLGALGRDVLGRDYFEQFVLRWATIVRMHEGDPRIRDLVLGLTRSAAPIAVDDDEDRYIASIALCMRGEARWQVGDAGAARADLERAIALGRDLGDRWRSLPKATVPLFEHLPSAHASLAAIRAASGDQAGALESARAAIALSLFPDFIRHRMAQQPALAALRQHPEWSQLLSP